MNQTLPPTDTTAPAPPETTPRSLPPECVDPALYQHLNQSAGWLLDAIENLAEAFVYWDAEDRLVLCNSKYPQQFHEPQQVRPGVRFSELVEQNIRTGRVVKFADIASVPDNPERYRQARLQQHRKGDGTFEVENYNQRWLQARERRTRDGGRVGIYTDITAIKHAESRERAAAQEAARANKAKSRFLAAASHDLRQPMHAIGILVSALSQQIKQPSQRELLSGIETCLNTMQSLFDSLLDVSRLDAEVIEPQPQPYALNDLLRAVEQEFRPQATSRKLQLRIRHSDRWSYSDPAMLGRILRNLVANAIKYTDHGRVLVAVRPRQGCWSLEVWDSGIGFPESQLGEMFREFKQLEVGQVRRQGLGLGLSIAKRLSDLLDHRIEVRSIPGRGSLFRVLIPRIAAPRRPSPATDPIAAASLPLQPIGLHVLVIDDDRDNLQATQLLLQQWGCRVSTATAVDSALALTDCPNLLLVDHHLKGEEKGSDAVIALREKFATEIPAVVITGDTEPEQLQQISQYGLPIAHKPLKPMRLRAILQRFQSQ